MESLRRFDRLVSFSTTSSLTEREVLYTTVSPNGTMETNPETRVTHIIS